MNIERRANTWYATLHVPSDVRHSRKIAAHLAMMANTSKAEQVRNYFLDMEKLALKLAERTPIRVSLIVENDNAATHYLLKHNADKVKKGGAKP